MAYYAAVISLKQTIKRLLHSSHISILPSDREIITSLDKRVHSLERVLGELEDRRNNISSKRLESFREQIREAAYKLEDALDSHVSDQFLSRSEGLGDEDSNSSTFCLDVSDEALKQKINSFADMVEKIEKECSELSKHSLLEEEEEEEEDSSRICFVGKETKMVGLSDEFSRAKEVLLMGSYSYGLIVPFTISGMAGIGKTTMAKKIYRDPNICDHFDCHMWVTIGQKYQIRKIILRLLAQLDYNVDNIQADRDEKLGNYLHTCLTSKRYLIVLDDVWDIMVFQNLRKFLPFHDKRSQVLVTTRLQEVAKYFSLFKCETLRFLNEKESWRLLREKVFGEKSCPYQLEKAGKKIAKNCDGLPLLIVTVADLLSKAEKTVEYWIKIAEGEDKSIFIEANDKISNIILRSYKYLRQESQSCFLYMGVFPSKCEIPTSRLYNLWIADDFSKSIYSAQIYLENLLSSNLVLECQDAAFGGIKTCSLHISVWHACVRQSWKEKFLHVINSSADCSKEGAISQRRLGIFNNVLFGIKEVYDAIESISGARSLICGGLNHQYPVPISFGLKLLKVLDILSARFYKFPIEVLKLIHLRYLALTYNGKIPPAISQLWNLEYLTIRRYWSIKFPGDWSCLPIEIWNLIKLRHLQVMGSCLPYLHDALLPELLKLSGINTHSCTKEIFKRIPNLQKLGIQIELVPNFDATKPLSCFDHLSHLNRLQSLKCVIVNPNPAIPQLVAPPTSVTTFPSCLQKLSLCGFGYQWSHIRVIGKLPNLRVLKLRSYAFRGPNWEAHKDEFQRIQYLLLEDLDLVHMTFHGFRYFPAYFKLVIKHCYKFKTIHLGFVCDIEIKLDDSPLIAKYIQENRLAASGRSFSVHTHASWEERELQA